MLRKGLMALIASTVALGSSAASAAVRPPPAGAPFSYQIGGGFPTPASVRIVDRDRSDRPVSGRYNICYLNAFQAQSGEHAWWLAHHRRLLLRWRGRPVIDQGWDEQLLDTSTPAKRLELAGVIGGWIRGCARAGFQAVELDNLDSWTRSHGALNRADNLAEARLLIARAHAVGLAAAQKNTPQLGLAGRHAGFSFAIAEECQVYSECGAYTRVYGREVLEIEYTDNGGVSNFLAACRARGSRVSIVLRNRAVAPAGRPGFVERRCPA